MQFAIMQWVSKNTKAGSIFGVLDAAVDRPVLPMISDNGHWEDHGRLDEYEFPFAAEAQSSIERYGYWLFGGSI